MIAYTFTILWTIYSIVLTIMHVDICKEWMKMCHDKVTPILRCDTCAAHHRYVTVIIIGSECDRDNQIRPMIDVFSPGAFIIQNHN
jgi:hypothetical protein